MEIQLKFYVPASKPSKMAPNGLYTVSKYEDGSWACSCPHFIYRLKQSGDECKHIKAVSAHPMDFQYEQISVSIDQDVPSEIALSSSPSTPQQTLASEPLPAKVRRYINLDEDEL